VGVGGQNSKRLLTPSQCFSSVLSFRREGFPAKSTFSGQELPFDQESFQLDEAEADARPGPEAGATVSADTLAACGR
jgi:hypothetical protein